MTKWFIVLFMLRFVGLTKIDVSHMFSFYTSTLYIVEYFMSQEPNFCIYTQQLSTHIDTKKRSRPILPLLCVVIQMCRNFTSEVEFEEYEWDHIYNDLHCCFCWRLIHNHCWWRCLWLWSYMDGRRWKTKLLPWIPKSI